MIHIVYDVFAACGEQSTIIQTFHQVFDYLKILCTFAKQKKC